MIDVTVRSIRVPHSIDAPEIVDLEAVRQLRNAHAAHVHGSSAYDLTLPQVLAAWQDQSDRPVIGRLAERNGLILGTASVDHLPDAQSRTAGVMVRVHAEHRRQGIGTRLLREAEAIAAELGRSVLQSWTEHRHSGGAGLRASTGFGSVPRDATAMFARKRGFRLEQVYRQSTLDLRSTALHTDALCARARTHAGDDYRYLFWLSPTPTPLAPALADLKSRMATDAPSGNVDVEDGEWDAERIARIEAHDAVGGVRRLIGAVRHEPSGVLVALNELNVSPADPTIAHQNDTLVRAEHRGRRLGTWVKCATLARLRELFPQVTHVETYNAEENRPMLVINEAIGFTPVSWAGEWQKRLS
ncbi:GNAT family N-acetyltransferase [Microbacterium hominis]|uniref:GNAT family N-acetyltransferase n=1 Tax=Microbacterium hominis TaxID=162426 RepID=UPI0009DDB34C|nr:GNAT family N-acetyltransferase [Microbacterium hominis]